MDIERGEFKINRCVCCGRSIKDEFMFCIGCERKRMKVLNDCVGAGMSAYDARVKVDTIFPLYFS